MFSIDYEMLDSTSFDPNLNGLHIRLRLNPSLWMFNVNEINDGTQEAWRILVLGSAYRNPCGAGKPFKDVNAVVLAKSKVTRALRSTKPKVMEH